MASFAPPSGTPADGPADGRNAAAVEAGSEHTVLQQVDEFATPDPTIRSSTPPNRPADERLLAP